MIFISVLESHYSCCAHEWSEGAMMIWDFIVGNTTLNECQHGMKMHLNYSILMMIKLLIPNKKVLDVAIVIHSFTHVWCPAIVVLLSYGFVRALTKGRGFLFHFKRNKGKFHRCHIKLISLVFSVSNFRRCWKLKTCYFVVHALRYHRKIVITFFISEYYFNVFEQKKITNRWNSQLIIIECQADDKLICTWLE